MSLLFVDLKVDVVSLTRYALDVKCINNLKKEDKLKMF